MSELRHVARCMFSANDETTTRVYLRKDGRDKRETKRARKVIGYFFKNSGINAKADCCFVYLVGGDVKDLNKLWCS